MDVNKAREELKKLQRELRRLKFRLPVMERSFVVALERICTALLKRLAEIK